MPSSYRPSIRPSAVDAPPERHRSALAGLPHVGPADHDVRRYSRARRNLLPRDERVVAVAGGWGHRAVLRADAQVDLAIWCPAERSAPAELLETAARVAERATRAVQVSERTLARIHPGLAAPALLSVVRLPRWRSELLRRGRLVLVADGIEYAGNLGTLVRTADGCAVDMLVLTRATARITHPKAFAASRGTLLTTPVLEFADVATARSALTAAGYTTYVADPAGATHYLQAGLGIGRTAVVVGSEGEGVGEEWRTGLTRVSIPMHGRADSLNVAVSAAVLLFEARARSEGARHRVPDPGGDGNG